MRPPSTLALARKVDPVPISESVVTAWARLVSDCRGAGIQRTVKLTDTLMAAPAIDLGLPVVTQDDAYDQMVSAHPSLQVRKVWEPYAPTDIPGKGHGRCRHQRRPLSDSSRGRQRKVPAFSCTSFRPSEKMPMMTYERVLSSTSSGGAVETIVGADPALVYEVVSDVTRYGRYSPENRSATWLHGVSRATRGATFRSWNKRRGFVWFTHCRIEVADPDGEFTFRVIFPPPMPQTRWSYRLFPVENGTRVRESWELPQPLGPLRKLMMWLFLGVRNRPESLTLGAVETLARMRESLDEAGRRTEAN